MFNDDKHSPPESGFLSLILSILFAGAVVATERLVETYFSNKRKEVLCRELHELVSKSLKAAGFPRSPTLNSFAAYIICEQSWMRGMLPPMFKNRFVLTDRR